MAAAVLVTGGAGYVGSHTCKVLHAAGYRPVALDNMVYGQERFVKWGPLVRADIRDAEAVRRVIEEHGISAVLHFAAYAYVGESMADPAKYYDNNVLGTLGLLEGMRRAGLDRIVFSSSCAVYGEPAELPITERTRPEPVNPYGRSKLIGEQILRDFGAAYGLRSVSLRYFNAAGADPDGDSGELREVETHLIPRALLAIQGKIDDFQVFGTDFPTPDGTAIRDYVHVSDLARAHVDAIGHLDRQEEPAAAFNLGTGQGASVKEVLDVIRQVTGRALPDPSGPRRPGDPASLVADPTLARRGLNFIPRHSSLRTIVETAWAWRQAVDGAPGQGPG